MKSSVLFVLLSFVGAVSLSARGTGSGPVPNINQTGQLEEAGFSGFLSAETGLIIPIPDCYPCTGDPHNPNDDPFIPDYEEMRPPMPKPPGLPKCYPVCVTEGVDSPQFQSLGLMSWSARLPFAARPEARVALTRVRAAA